MNLWPDHPFPFVNSSPFFLLHPDSLLSWCERCIVHPNLPLQLVQLLLCTPAVCCAVPVRGSSPVWLPRSHLQAAALWTSRNSAWFLLSMSCLLTWPSVLLLHTCCLSILEPLSCSSDPLLPNCYLFPECLLSKGFLSALLAMSLSCMFYFLEMLPIKNKFMCYTYSNNMQFNFFFYSVVFFFLLATIHPFTGVSLSIQYSSSQNF